MIEFFCPQFKKTGEYCHQCQPYAGLVKEMVDRTTYTPYNGDMKTYQTGSKDVAPLTERNEALYKFVKEGHSYAEAGARFNITRVRAYQLAKNQEKKIEKAKQSS